MLLLFYCSLLSAYIDYCNTSLIVFEKMQSDSSPAFLTFAFAACLSLTISLVSSVIRLYFSFPFTSGIVLSHSSLIAFLVSVHGATRSWAIKFMSANMFLCELEPIRDVLYVVFCHLDSFSALPQLFSNV